MEFKRSIYTELEKWKERKTGRVLQLEGARQVGKTFLLDKFARENFKCTIYINMAETSGRRFTECLEQAEEWKPGTPQPTMELHKALHLFNQNFVDTKDTIIVIDEIQESATIFNKIREFARKFECYVVVTGSYLGKVLDPGFFLPAGDIDKIEMETLSFEEFLDVFEKRDLFESLDLFGTSSHEAYDEIKEYFEIYKRIGGYPAVVNAYVESRDISECDRMIWSLIDIFVNESMRYFDEILDVNLFEKLFEAIGSLIISEKTGIRDLASELSSIVYQAESGRVTKKMVNHAISWLEASHIVGYAAKCVDCNYLEVKVNSRIYFMDLGIAHYFLELAGAEEKDLKGSIAENFVYLILRRHNRVDIVGELPWFATWQKTKGELDFFSRGKDGNSYGIEVKASDNAAKTARAIFDAKKVNYLYYLKGDSYGGIAEEGRLLTIPLYLAPKIRLDYGKAK